MGGGVTKHARRQTKTSSKKTVLLSESLTRGQEKVVMDILDKNPELLNAELDDDGMRPLQVCVFL